MDITKKIDAVTKIGEKRIQAGGLQSAPKSVKIEITNKCNLRCKFCSLRTRGKGSNADMDFDFFRTITEDMKRSGVEEIGLFYLGESFMSPELLEKCCRWVKKDLEFEWVFLTSNAVRAFPEHVQAVMEAGLDSLKWSVNYDSYSVFHKITGGSAKQFDQSQDNIMEAYETKRLGGYNTILSASSILFSDNENFIGNMRAYLMRMVIPFVERHYWLPLYQMAMYKKDVVDAIGYVPTSGNMGRLDDETMLPNRTPLPCWTTFTEGHVRVDGGLSACCFGSDDRFDMGILDGFNFMKTWNSLKFQALREAQIRTIQEGHRALLNTPCRVCVAYEDVEKEDYDLSEFKETAHTLMG